MTAEELIAEHNKIDGWIKSETKRFTEHLAPAKTRLEKINNDLLALSNEAKWESVRTDAGTAYRSTLMNTTISSEDSLPYVNAEGQEVTGREAVIDFCLEHWDAIGSDMLLVSTQKDAVKRWVEERGQPPPGIRSVISLELTFAERKLADQPTQTKGKTT